MTRLMTVLLGVVLLAGAVRAEAEKEVTLSDLLAMFRRLDQDGDARVTQQEHAQFWQAVFASQDKDGNGLITLAEYTQNYPQSSSDDVR